MWGGNENECKPSGVTCAGEIHTTLSGLKKTNSYKKNSTIFKKNKKQKKGGVSVGIQQAAGCLLQGTSFKLQMLKSKCGGLGFKHHLHKAQISLFTCHLERNAVNRAAAAAAAAVVVSPAVSICLVACCCCCLVHAPPTERSVFSLFGLWLQDANRPLKQVDAITAAAGGFCFRSTGCESMLVLVSLFVVVLFFQQTLLMVSFGRFDALERVSKCFSYRSFFGVWFLVLVLFRKSVKAAQAA